MLGRVQVPTNQRDVIIVFSPFFTTSELFITIINLIGALIITVPYYESAEYLSSLAMITINTKYYFRRAHRYG